MGRRKRKPSALARLYLDAWRTQVGDICVGYANPRHPARGSTLTVDHIVPVAKGGRDVWPNFQVLCRRCNSRKHDLRVEYPPVMATFPNPLTRKRRQ